ncbi:NAD(P)H-dependent oxidoreductase [Actinomadura fibrosa]|uniref:NAD(P)H-dependent oxidoreductase n=1 Tax=Actinomadura fibrosa TaxID=111802 RepID=A0ABW2XF95_9ACTN|nr:NAD(P)H-dependent oxidoreductase [Actinomadura fibrosa]
MTRTLVVLAHPDLATSRVNAALADGVRDLPDVTVHDLYAAHPDLRIDVPGEQRLLDAHDRVVLQFPFYWYSVPPLLKKWLDEVFERGWAYGPGGAALRGKRLQLATAVGGREELYRPEGLNRFAVRDLLRPFDATAHLTGMRYEEPFIVHGASSLADEELEREVRRYRELLLDAPVPVAA